MSSEKNLKPVILFDIDYTLFNTQVFKDSQLTHYALYNEIEAILKDLALHATLGIFSEGEKDFQIAKLLKTNIHLYFNDEDIHIFEKKDDNFSTVIEKYSDRKVVLVDDKLPILFSAKNKKTDLVTVWVKRGVYAQNQSEIQGFEPDATVSDLSSLASFLLSII